jgi:hypothetical protein
MEAVKLTLELKRADLTVQVAIFVARIYLVGGQAKIRRQSADESRILGSRGSYIAK